MSAKQTLEQIEALDMISDALRLENWFEGKTLTVMVTTEEGATKFVKLRLAGILDKPSSADLRGEPE